MKVSLANVRMWFYYQRWCQTMSGPSFMPCHELLSIVHCQIHN